jgi:glutathione S-transferase
MLTIHHLGLSQSERIVWLCEELELPYKLVRYDRDSRTRLAPAEYKALHPLGTAPIIQDGDVTLAETGAIVDYIVAKYNGQSLTLGPNDPGFADYLFWLHFANGSLMPGQMMGLIAARIPGQTEEGAKMLDMRASRAFGMLEKRLGETPYLAGDTLTAADIVTVFSLTTMRMFGPRDISGYPNILAYLQRIAARPAYQRAMAKAEPGMTPLLS